MVIRVFLALLVALASGCDPVEGDGSGQLDGGGSSTDGGAGAFDGGLEDGSTGDAARPDAAGPTCAEQITADETFAIAPGLGQTQIHGDAAFTGHSLWFTFNREEADGANFDVWATQIGCDGGVLTAPFIVTEALGFNDVDPVIAVTDDRVVIAWSRDSAGLDPNLSLLYRVYDLDGAAQGGERVLGTNVDGEPLVANHWLPALTRRADGFAIAGARGIEGMGFQTFVQRLDRDGAPVGAVVARVGQHGQIEPEITADATGRMYVAWTEQRDVDTVVHTELAAAGDAFEPAPEAPFMGTSSGVKLSAAAGLWIAASVDPGGGPKVGLLRGGQFGGPVAPLLFGAPGKIDHSPTVVGDAEGGWIGWYRSIGGIRSEVWISRFKVDEAGAPGASDEPLQIPTVAPAAPYGLVVHDVGGGFAFVAWSEGASPNFTIQARFVRHE